jgi:hypothetical protein
MATAAPQAPATATAAAASPRAGQIAPTAQGARRGGGSGVGPLLFYFLILLLLLLAFTAVGFYAVMQPVVLPAQLA